MLSYSNALPENLLDYYQYLLDYAMAEPSNVENVFYWEKVKFGLNLTLRIVQMVTLHGHPSDPVAYAIAQKQLYASHSFETALDLSFCVREIDDSKQPGFHLIMTEQAGLTGVKGKGHDRPKDGSRAVGCQSPEHPQEH